MPSSSSLSSDPSTGNVVYNVKLSSVVPGTITKEEKRRHELNNADLIMKLHYITAVHLFEKEAVEGLEVPDLKKPMFDWLEIYYPICGRIRREDDGGRPYVKCNDSGVRVVEAKCAKTIADWRLDVSDGYNNCNDLLVYSQPLGADFGFTPLVFIQFTKFKCGGLSIGMSWAHILGDVFSATQCINMYGKMIMNSKPPEFPYPKVVSTNGHIKTDPSPLQSCRSLKLLDPLGDNWFIPKTCKMKSHTFLFEESFLSKIDDHKLVKSFEFISAVIWKSLAKVRGIDKEPKIVTICKKGLHKSGENELLCNGNMAIGIVDASMMSSIFEAESLDLAKLMADKFVDETKTMEKLMEEGNVNSDYMVYGANLTFVNLEEVSLYGMQVKGHKPVFADLSIGGVGDEGAVVVLPSDGENGGGRIVNMILPEYQLQGLTHQLRVELGFS